MDYIVVNNWDKHQRYKDRRPKWIKLEIDIIDEFDEYDEPKKFYPLSDCAKLTFICLLCLRANFQNKIPNKGNKWLAERLGIKRVEIQPLVNAGYISIVTDSGSIRDGIKTEDDGKKTELDGTTTETRQNQDAKATLEIEKERELEKENRERDIITPPPPFLLGEFHNVDLLPSEHQKLKSKFGDIGAAMRIENISQYIQNFPEKASKYKSHYATILMWDRKDKKENPGNQNSPPLNPPVKKTFECQECKTIVEDTGQEEKLCNPCLDKKYPPVSRERILELTSKITRPVPDHDQNLDNEEERLQKLRAQAQAMKGEHHDK